jgi:septal ring factor EnvC (AmiA/AmiB activator)
LNFPTVLQNGEENINSLKDQIQSLEKALLEKQKSLEVRDENIADLNQFVIKIVILNRQFIDCVF